MNGKKPDRRKINITEMGGSILDSGVLEEEIVDEYYGDEEEEGDLFITRKRRGQPDGPHPWAEPYVVCNFCNRIYCKTCFYLGSIRQCTEKHYTCTLCWRRSWFSIEPVCGICGSPLLLPPTRDNGDRMPEKRFRLLVPLWLAIPGAFLLTFLLLPGWVYLAIGFLLIAFFPEIAKFGLEVLKRRVLGEPKNR